MAIFFIGLLTSNTLFSCTNTNQVLGMSKQRMEERVHERNELLDYKERIEILRCANPHFASLVENGTTTLIEAEKAWANILKEQESSENTRQENIKYISWPSARILKWIGGIAVIGIVCGTAIYYLYYTPGENMPLISRTEELLSFENLKTRHDHLSYMHSIKSREEAENYLASLDAEDRKIRSNTTIQQLIAKSKPQCFPISRLLRNINPILKDTLNDNLFTNKYISLGPIGELIKNPKIKIPQARSIGICEPSKLVTILRQTDSYSAYF